MALEVRSRRIGSGDRSVEILDVVGRLDVPGGALLRTAIQDKLKEESPRIAINLSECIEINREMVGTIHSLGRACKRAGGGLVLYGASGDVLEYIKRFADKELAPWFEKEREAVIALGGEVEPEIEDIKEPPVIVALGIDQLFKKLFWQLGVLGGKPVAKFDNIESAENYIKRRRTHSIVIDTKLNTHRLIVMIRQIRKSPEVRDIGIFIVGPPSTINIGKILIREGGTNFVPYVFNGQEIPSKLDGKAFFQRLKEAYERYEAGPGAIPG